jgi:hypothetical protein
MWSVLFLIDIANLDGEDCHDQDVQYVFLGRDVVCTADGEDRTCLGTFDPTANYFTNITVNNANRSWLWMVYAFSSASISNLTILLGATKSVSTRLGLLKANLRS